MRTYSDSKKIYSVDLMIAYVNIYKPQTIKINPNDYINSIINYKGWGNPTKKIFYSPQDVLNNPIKYKDDYERIMNANLKFPIIISKNNNIVDGVHRLIKAYIMKKQIMAYVFDNNLLKKFLINKNGDYEKVDNLSTSDLIELFNRRFKCAKV